MINSVQSAIRVYQRSSKSPWDDASTYLLLASSKSGSNGEPVLEDYIYLHRDKAGRNLGISISKSLRDRLEAKQYLQGDEMYRVLSICSLEIAEFCIQYADDFEAIFGLPPDIYMEVAMYYWSIMTKR